METYQHQHTLQRPVTVAGIGLHTGRRITMTLRPAPADSGIRFVRTDRGPHAVVPASYRHIRSTNHATELAAGGVSINTVEHLLAALAGLAIDNCVIELDGPEVPIMDGSAEPFVALLRDTAGRRPQAALRRYLVVTRPVSWSDGDRSVMIEPFDGFKVTCSIDFPHRLIRQQEISVTVTPRAFAERIAPARTFGFLEQIEELRQAGCALGGSLENAVVLDRFGVVNEEGLRFTDEFVRHKVLDCIGDLALLGRPLRGHVIVRKAGHTQHAAFMQEFAAKHRRWRLVAADRCRPRPNRQPLPVLPVIPGLIASRPVVTGKPAI